MKIFGMLFLCFIGVSSSTHATTTVQFECTDAIQRGSVHPVIEGVVLNKSARNEAQGFGFSCLKNQRNELQIAEIPAGTYNVSCSNIYNKKDFVTRTLVFDANKTYKLALHIMNETCSVSLKSGASVDVTAVTLDEPKTERADSLIIKDKFLTLPVAENFQAENVIVELVANPGKNNLGVYKITVTEPNKEQIYFAKLAVNDDESMKYEALKEQIAWFNAHAEKTGAFPYFATYEGTFSLPWSVIKKNFNEAVRRQKSLPAGGDRKGKDVPVLVMQEAPGVSLHEWLKRVEVMPIEKIGAMYETIGRTLGNFNNFESQIVGNYRSRFDTEPTTHIIGTVHSDGNSDNIFYDERTKKVTFIDYDNFMPAEVVEQRIKDFFENIWHDLLPAIRKTKNGEQANKIKSAILSMQKGFEAAFEDSSQKLALVKYAMMNFLQEFEGKNYSDFLKNYFTAEELPNFEQLRQEYQKAVKLSTQ